MNNKDIEENIKVLQKFIKATKGKDYNTDRGWHGYYDDELIFLGKTIENILADRKEKEQYIKQIADMLNIAEDQIPIELGVQLEKANKYDRLAERIKENLDKRKQKYNEILNDYGNIDTDVIFNIPNANVRKRLDELSFEIVILQELIKEE